MQALPSPIHSVHPPQAPQTPAHWGSTSPLSSLLLFLSPLLQPAGAPPRLLLSVSPSLTQTLSRGATSGQLRDREI